MTFIQDKCPHDIRMAAIAPALTFPHKYVNKKSSFFSSISFYQGGESFTGAPPLPPPRPPPAMGFPFVPYWPRLYPSCCVCLVAQSCPTFCDPMDCSLPGSSVQGDSPMVMSKSSPVKRNRITFVGLGLPIFIPRA